MLYVVVVLLTIRQYAFVVRLDIQYFCSSSLSTNILGIGMKTPSHRRRMQRVSLCSPAVFDRIRIRQELKGNLRLHGEKQSTEKSTYARHLLRQPPLECESTPSEGFLAAAAPICFFFNQTGF